MHCWIVLCIVAILLRDSILFYLSIIPDIGFIFHSITDRDFCIFNLLHLALSHSLVSPGMPRRDRFGE